MWLSFTLIIFKKGNHIKDKVLTYESHRNIHYDRGCESWTLDQILKDGWIFVRCMQNHVKQLRWRVTIFSKSSISDIWQGWIEVLQKNTIHNIPN